MSKSRMEYYLFLSDSMMKFFHGRLDVPFLMSRDSKWWMVIVVCGSLRVRRMTVVRTRTTQVKLGRTSKGQEGTKRLLNKRLSIECWDITVEQERQRQLNQSRKTTGNPVCNTTAWLTLFGLQLPCIPVRVYCLWGETQHWTVLLELNPSREENLSSHWVSQGSLSFESFEFFLLSRLCVLLSLWWRWSWNIFLVSVESQGGKATSYTRVSNILFIHSWDAKDRICDRCCSNSRKRGAERLLWGSSFPTDSFFVFYAEATARSATTTKRHTFKKRHRQGFKEAIYAFCPMSVHRTKSKEV